MPKYTYVDGMSYTAAPVRDLANPCAGCAGEGSAALCRALGDGCEGVIFVKAPVPLNTDEQGRFDPALFLDKEVKDTTEQRDPTGKDLHAPGAKADAGKAEYDMALFSFPQALAAVDAVGKFGAVKYTKGGFLDVPNGQRRYFNAEIRHGAAHQGGETHDPESGKLHLAHKAWNALAELELYLRGKGA